MIIKEWLNVMSLTNEKYVEEADPTHKKSKVNSSWKKITAIAASACVFFLVLFVSIYVPSRGTSLPTTTKLEWGFKYGNGEPIPSESCAYKSETDTFDIDNVTLAFYFGGAFSEDISSELENVSNIPEFDVYFADSEHKPIYTVRHSAENFVSEKYRVTRLYDEKYNITELKYNHSESITIPQELFSKEKGVIRFCVSGTNINEREPEYKIITGVYINYDIVNEKVILSPWDGYRN